MSRRTLAVRERPQLWRDEAGNERAFFRIPELRADDAGEGGGIHFSGHAAVFNVRSLTLGGPFMPFREIVRAGAFAKTIREADIRFLHNHNVDQVLARRRGDDRDTMRLSEDSTGLLVDADWPDTGLARDLATSLRRGDVDQMSFGFSTVRDEWFEEDDGLITRELYEVKLRDVSTVTFPAYVETDAGVRAENYDQLVRALGLDGLGAEERSVAIRSLTNSDADPDLIRRVTEAIAARAAKAPDAPAAQAPERDDALRLRHHALAVRYGIAPAAGQ